MMYRMKQLHHPLLFALSRRLLQAKPLQHHKPTAWVRFFSQEKTKGLTDTLPPGSSTVSKPSSDSVKSTLTKPSLKERIMAELRHYWHGTKLFGAETKASCGILKRYYFPGDAKAVELTRRELLQLARSRVDVLKLFPFMIFVIVPFLEFALPVVLKFFPNMLPSTFESVEQREAKYMRVEEKRRAVATMLRAWLQANHSSVLEKFDLEPSTNLPGRVAHLRKLSIGFASPSTPLSQPLLGHVSRFLGHATYYPSAVLISRLRTALSNIRADDLLIQKEGGPAKLTLDELRAACFVRGIPVLDGNVERMQRELLEWIEWTTKEVSHVSLEWILCHALRLSEAKTVSRTN